MRRTIRLAYTTTHLPGGGCVLHSTYLSSLTYFDDNFPRFSCGLTRTPHTDKPYPQSRHSFSRCPAVSRFIAACPISMFSVELESYRGPLDLLLYLVKKHEVEVVHLPIAQIAEQYFEYLEILSEIEIDSVGEFLDLASRLIEIKSRLVLPSAEEQEETLDDPRDGLVQQLLEYKQFKDAASRLDEQSRSWQRRYARVADDLPPRTVDPAEQPIHQVELWDLVSAFGRMIRDHEMVKPATIVYDDTPIHVYMNEIRKKITSGDRLRFSGLFQPGMHKSAMIGVFLAVLELVRHNNVRTDQDDAHGEIWIHGGNVEGDFDTADTSFS